MWCLSSSHNLLGRRRRCWFAARFFLGRRSTINSLGYGLAGATPALLGCGRRFYSLAGRIRRRLLIDDMRIEVTLRACVENERLAQLEQGRGLSKTACHPCEPRRGLR